MTRMPSTRISHQPSTLVPMAMIKQRTSSSGQPRNSISPLAKRHIWSKPSNLHPTSSQSLPGERWQDWASWSGSTKNSPILQRLRISIHQSSNNHLRHSATMTSKPYPPPPSTRCLATRKATLSGVVIPRNAQEEASPKCMSMPYPTKTEGIRKQPSAPSTISLDETPQAIAS